VRCTGSNSSSRKSSSRCRGRLIAETINVIAVLVGRGAERQLVELAVVKGVNEEPIAGVVRRHVAIRRIRFLR
jgi:hypothetical protein